MATTHQDILSVGAGGTIKRRTRLGAGVRIARRKPLATLGLILIALIVLVVAIGPVISAHGAYDSDPGHLLAHPSPSHWLGTDQYSRDVFARITAGGRISLLVGFGAVAISSLVGSAIGLSSGYLGGKGDFFIQRLVDAEMSIPALLLLLISSAVLGHSVGLLVVTIGILLSIPASRVVRASVLGVTPLPFIEACHALGAGHVRIVLRHLLPNIMATVLVLASLGIGQAIIIESTLSFLGYGVPPPQPSWGAMLGGSSRPFMYQAPWLPLIPGIALALTVYAFNMIGDGLRDLLDPKLRTP
jgi:peptide/nickel transport system permease protein